MVVMGVGDEDEIDVYVVDEMCHGVGVAVDQPQTVYEQRVGENVDAIQLNQDSRVPEVPKMRTHAPSLMRE
jgi:hypothetical protein